MSKFEWDDKLLVGVEPMDQTHREFVALLGEVSVSEGPESLEALQRLIAHTQVHFRQEEDWMADSGWGPPCHAGEHQQVLAIMREVHERAGKGEMQLVAVLARELGPWFEHHAASMDSALVAHMANVGYQPRAEADSALPIA